MNTQDLLKNSYIMIRWTDLEKAWEMMASPNKCHSIPDILETVREVSITASPGRAIFTMVAATAWLTDDSPSTPGFEV